MKEPGTFCPNVCADIMPTGEFIVFCASSTLLGGRGYRRSCSVYYCTLCGEVFALNHDGAFCPVPDEAVQA